MKSHPLVLAVLLSLAATPFAYAGSPLKLMPLDAATLEAWVARPAESADSVDLSESMFYARYAHALAYLWDEEVSGLQLEQIALSVAMKQSPAVRDEVGRLAKAGVFRTELPERIAQLALAKDVKPSTSWHEDVQPGEPEKFEGFAREIEAQQHAAAGEGPLRRGFHAKIHAGLQAEFRVLGGLPEFAKIGVFAEPHAFPAVVRFSNGNPKLQGDGKPDPRGIAIKLIGVPGKKLLPGLEDAVTMDFLATSHSVTSTVRNVDQFFAFIRAAKNMLTLPITLARELGVVESARLLKAFASTVVFAKVRSMALEQYSSTAPLKLGPYAIKFTVRPSEGTAPASPRPKTDGYLHEELAERLRAGDIVLDFLIQFYVDDTRTPIEDTSVAWRPEVAPFVKVGELRIFRCDIDSTEQKAFTAAVDQLSFNPWHTTADQRPLGNIMRARKVAYAASSTLRGHAAEPTKIADVTANAR